MSRRLTTPGLAQTALVAVLALAHPRVGLAASPARTAPESLNVAAALITASHDQCLARCDTEYPDPNQRADRHACRIQCKSTRLKDEICAHSTLLAHDAHDILSTAQQEETTIFCDQATRWVNLANEADYKTIGQRRSTECVVIEYDTPDPADDDCDFDDDGTDDCEHSGNLWYFDDGNNDTICDLKSSGQGTGPGKYDEWCQEVLDDGIGDDDGYCEQQGRGNKRYFEPCVQVCGLETVESQEENYEEEKFLGIEELLDDASTDVMAANRAVAERIQVLSRLRRTRARLTQSNEPQQQCLGMLEAQVGNVTYTEREPYWALNLTMTAFTVADAAYNICGAPTSTVVLGNGNYKVICMVFAVAQGVAHLAYQQSELFDDTISAERIDNAAMCLEHLGDKIKELKRGMDEANVKLDELLLLMNKPQGRRPWFPEKGCNLDRVCDPGESLETCPIDCSVCGDGWMTGYEQCESDADCLASETCSSLCACVPLP